VVYALSHIAHVTPIVILATRNSMLDRIQWNPFWRIQMNKLVKYFDLSPRPAPKRAFLQSVGIFPWFLQYLALVLGIIVQPFLTAYQQTGAWHVNGLVGRIVFALITGLIVFPAVYRRAFDPEKPLFVQFCAVFAAGMGWESLLKTAVKGVGQATGLGSS
jgi:hypothetical protein